MDLITKQELVNIYEWKIIERVLKSEYTWIKSIDIDETNLMEYISLLVDIHIDPFIFSDTFNKKIHKNVLRNIIKGIEVSYFDFIFIFNLDLNQSESIRQNIEETIEFITKSKSIPDELMISQNRPIKLHELIIKPNEKFIEEANKRLNQ